MRTTLGRLHELSNKLTETESVLSAFFNMRDELFIIANKDQFIKVNAAWERAFGYTSEEMCAQKYWAFIHPDDLAKTMRAHENLMEDKSLGGFINRYRCKDGAYKSVQWDATPYADDRYTYAVAKIVEVENE